MFIVLHCLLVFNQWEERIFNLSSSSTNEKRGLQPVPFFNQWEKMITTCAFLHPMRIEDFQPEHFFNQWEERIFNLILFFIQWEERIFNMTLTSSNEKRGFSIWSLFFIQWEKSIFKLIPTSANEKRGITYLSFSGHMSTIPVTRDSTMQNSLSMPIVWNESMQWKVLLRLFSMFWNYSFN